MYYNGNSSFLVVNATKIYQFKANGSEIKKISLVFSKYLKEFHIYENEKTGLNGCVYEFSVDYNIIDTSNIVNIHKYLLKKQNIK